MSVRWVDEDPLAPPWALVSFGAPGSGAPRFLVRTTRARGRREIDSVVAEQVDPHLLRQMPVSRIEFLLSSLIDRESEIPERGKDGLITTEADPLTREISSVWRRIQKQDVAQRPSTFDPGRAPLRRPDGSGSDEFYRNVAAAYMAAMRHTRAVAPVLAAEADVPVRTVHGWIAEARRRGFLPPATSRGRA